MGEQVCACDPTSPGITLRACLRGQPVQDFVDSYACYKTLFSTLWQNHTSSVCVIGTGWSLTTAVSLTAELPFLRAASLSMHSEFS